MKSSILKYAAFFFSMIFLTVFTSCEKDDQIAPQGVDGSLTQKGATIDPFQNGASSALNELGEVTGQEGPNFVDEIYVNVTSTVYTYGSGTDNTMEVFVSPDNNLAEKPVVILYPGGGFSSHTQLSGLNAFAQELASKGYLAAVSKYSLSADANIDVDDWVYAVQDVRSSIRFVRSQATAWGASTQNIFIGGWSNGGQIAFNHAFMSASETGDFTDPNLQPYVAGRLNALGWDNTDNVGFSSDIKGIIGMNIYTQGVNFVDAGDPALYLVACTDQQFNDGTVTFDTTFTYGGISFNGPEGIYARALHEGYTESKDLVYEVEQWPSPLFTHPNFTTLNRDYWYDMSAFMARNMD
ncbi:alpha/beta hydrolase [Cryomorphaceae bacterium]|nr:alpha/beta hydrolase [Cryomorphaceae bacterium]